MTHSLSSSTESPLVILNRKRSASDWGSRDCGLDSRFRGNDTPLSSSTESEALRIGDPSPPVILNRKRSASDWGSSPVWIPAFAGMTHSLSSSTDCPLVILNRKRSASDWGSSPSWIPVFTGMTHSCHPQLDWGSS